MQRLKLWYETPQGDNLDSWIYDIRKQVERINWDEYDAEQAALDAICFQTTDGKWRHKILSEKLTLQEAIDYGRTSAHTRIKTKKLEDTTNGKSTEESLSRLNNSKGTGNGCKNCGFDSHMSGKCPAKGKECFKCGRKDHFGHAPACSGKKKKKEKAKSKGSGKDGKTKGGKSKSSDKGDDKAKKKKKWKKGALCCIIQPKDPNAKSSSSEDESDEEDESSEESAGRILQEERVG